MKEGLTIGQLSEINAELHTEIAALLKERDALAVENAKAKSVLKQCQEYFIAGIRNEIRPTNEGYLHMICDTFDDETPTTDAAIASIQAQGVKNFIGRIEWVIRNECNHEVTERILAGLSDFSKELHKVECDAK